MIKKYIFNKKRSKKRFHVSFEDFSLNTYNSKKRTCSFFLCSVVQHFVGVWHLFQTESGEKSISGLSVKGHSPGTWMDLQGR
jgi:hypothetical protein